MSSLVGLAGLVPVFVFLACALAIAMYSRNRAAKAASGGFVGEYFPGNRSLGAFVLAMTTIATYGSVSSFVGGPGQAWQTGFGWVYMAAVQVTTLFLLYGLMGKKMAFVSRKLGAVTVIDVIRARCKSDALANVAAIIIVVFFAATMIAQFVGGAKLFAAVTGYSYVTGLVIFAVAVVAFTTLGGFRGVAITDALCGIAMLVGVVVLAYGTFSAGVLTGDLVAYGGSVDNIIPRVIVETLPPWLAGIAIVGPIAASISTVSSLLIAASSAVVKDVWLNYRRPAGADSPAARDDRVVRVVSHAMTLFIGIVVLVLSITPPDLIWRINMFAFGGLETTFCWVLVCGLFWKRATKVGAILSMVGGAAAYCIAMALGFRLFGLHQIVIGIPVALVLMVVGSLATKRPDEDMLAVFFPND